MRSSMVFRFVTAAALFLAANPLPAQKPAPAPAPTTPAPSPGGSIPSPTPTPPGRQPSPTPGQRNPNENPFPQAESPRAIFLSGKVMLEDGTPPPESVTIERVCNGIARPQAYTDSKGRFSFQLGDNMAMLPDASVGSASDAGMGFPGTRSNQGRGGFGNSRGMTEQQLMSCELRAVLPGYRSEAVNLAGRRALDNPDVGVILLHRLGNVEGTTVSITSLEAPKDAKKAFEKGHNALKKKKAEDAEKQLQKAVTVYPKYAAAWFELGVSQEMQNRPEEARKSYAQALAADGKFLKPYLQLAAMAAREKKWQETADQTDRCIKLDPYDFPQAYFLNSVAYLNLGKVEQAEKSAREAQKLDTQHQYPKVNQLLGIILANRHDYSGALASMRDYLKFAPDAQDADRVRTQVSELEKLAGSQASAPQKP